LTVTAELQLPTDHLLGGQTLSGTLRLDASGAANYSDLSVRLCRHKQVGDEVDTICVAEAKLEAERKESEGHLERDFTLDLPRGPYSFETPHASLSWTVEASAAIQDQQAHSQQATDVRPVVLSAPDTHPDSAKDAHDDPDMTLDGCWSAIAPITRMPDTPEEKAEALLDVRLGPAAVKKTSGMGCMILFAGIMLLIVLGGASTLGEMRPAEMVMMYGMFSAMVLFIGGFLSFVVYDNLRNLLAQRTLGPVDLQVWPMETFCGEKLSFSLDFTPRRDVDIRQIQAELRCQEVVNLRSTSKGRGSSSSSTSTSKKTNIHHQVSFPLHPELTTLQAGETFAAAEILEIPEDVRSSLFWRCPWWLRMLPLPFMLLSIERKWVIWVHIEAGGAPDWESEFKFLVHP
jgi:hypothetical protein